MGTTREGLDSLERLTLAMERLAHESILVAEKRRGPRAADERPVAPVEPRTLRPLPEPEAA